jgi:hypothetical protein
VSVHEAVRTTKDARLEVRLSVQELERVRDAAGRVGLSASEFVRRAVLRFGRGQTVEEARSELGVGDVVPHPVKIGLVADPVPVVASKPSRVSPSKPFGCPACNWKTDNMKASCPTHKRTVVGC